MRSSSRFLLVAALLAFVLGIHRWMRPPGSGTSSSSAGPTAVMPGTGSVSTTAAVSRAALRQVVVKELPAGAMPSPGDTNFPWRASNTRRSLADLAGDSRALLLRNALIDTASDRPLPIPAGLVAGPEPGFHLVQAAREPDAAFRQKIEEAGLRIISYIPNNAFLVQGSDEAVHGLSIDPDVAATPPWHPAFKLEPELLVRAIERRPLDPGERLMISVTDPAALDRLTALGVQEVARQRGPFGSIVTVDAPPDALVALARSPDIHLVEEAHARELLNDRSGYLLGSTTDDFTNTVHYLGLTGSNIVININDSGIDWRHPDLTTNRVATVGSQTNLLQDPDGHGTHVAGTIAGNGTNSLSLAGPMPVQGSVTNANFRGHAPNARLFVLPIDLRTGPTISDAFLQEQAARTNALISNNSWGYVGAFNYNSISASYDAAARDALPDESGEQPVLFVFAAGNSGAGGDNGVGGRRGSVTVPGNAKNVVTVGALESRRMLTNAVLTDSEGNLAWAGGRWFRPYSETNEYRTNLVLAASSDSDNEVANFSSRGNIGIGIEGAFGRFKPDVVAPGSHIVSARSSQWDLAAEYDTNSVQYAVFDELNRPVGPWYRFLSGTSMAAPAVSGFLAQVQEFSDRRSGNGGVPRYLEVAAYKALLINSARPTAENYNPDFHSLINYAGWGRPRLDRALASGVHVVDRPETELLGFSDELATGASSFLRLRFGTNEASVSSPMHVTLVWTDPPGNPAAGFKLVNDLDLIVSNAVTGEVFIGNDFERDGSSAPRSATNLFSVSIDGATNSLFDVVNNVERVVLRPPLSPEYVLQIRARRVNVNALASRIPIPGRGSLTNIVQDFIVALSSDAAVSNAVVATAEFLDNGTGALARVEPPPVTVIATNGIPVPASRVGANSPLVGGFPGQTNQWHFFVFTNRFDPVAAAATGLTNGRFVEFNISSAVNLSRPRGPGSGFSPVTRVRERFLGPDLDLYVSRDAGLTNLDAAVLASALRSAGRGGEERIEITNAPANGEVYYVGVKSEDQQAGEFEMIVRSSNEPFAQMGPNGLELVMTPTVLSRNIPDGTPDNPGVIRYFGSGPSGLVRNVTVAQYLNHEQFRDLQGTLFHGGYDVVLNNRGSIREAFDGTRRTTGLVEGWYDDRPGFPLRDIFNVFSQPADGPETSLLDFAGFGVGGAWNFLEQDDVLGAEGLLNRVRVQVQPEPQFPFDARVFETICLGPRGYDFRIRLVPPDASRLIIEITNMAPAGLPLEVYVRRENFPDPVNPDVNDRVATINSPGGVVSITARDVPPLQSGFYFVLFHNPAGVELCFDVAIYGERNLSGRFTGTVDGSGGNVADIARTISSVSVQDGRPISDVEVAVRARHDRVSDLALRLVAPGGSGALLFENRGLATTNGLGGVLLTSNLQHVAVTLDRVSQRASLYFNGEQVASDFVPRGITNLADSFVFGSDPSATISGLPVRVDDFGVWRRSLRPDEVRRIVQEGGFGRGKSPSMVAGGLVALWPFDLTGTELVAGQTAGFFGPPPVPLGGAIDSALLLPGSPGGASVTNGGALRASTLAGFTLDGWVKPDAGNAGVVVAGWFDRNQGVFGPALLVGQSPPWGSGPGSVSAVFADASGDLRVVSSPPGLFTENGIVTNRAYAVFSDNTNGVYTPIKFAEPPFMSRTLPSTIVSNDWESLAGGEYSAATNGSYVEQWRVLTNAVTIVEGDAVEDNVLDIRNASILRRFTLNTGQSYTMSFVTRAAPGLTNTPVAEVRVEDQVVRLLEGSSGWVTNRASFVAESGDVPVEIRATAPAATETNAPAGLQIGRLWIDQAGSSLTYLPEEPIRPLLGRPGTGDWQLQLTDARGAISGELLDWQLRITYMPTNTPAIRLTNGFTYTTNIVGDEPRYFIVDVPPEADRATNILENLGGGPLYLLYSDSGLPDLTEPSDVFLDGPVTGRSVTVLNTNLPPLLPHGQRYYLGVRSFDPAATNLFSIRVDFGLRITPLTNGVPFLATNSNPSLAEFYSYDVPSNNVLGVTFALTGLTTDFDLVASRSPNLPSATRYDYRSANPGLSNEVIVVSLSSAPVPLTPGLWYLAVVNASGQAPAAYTIVATEQRGTVTRLTPGIFMDAQNNGAVPDYFFLDVPDDGLAFRVSLRFLDEDLVLAGRSSLPLPASVSAEYVSDRPGTSDEDIVVTPDSSPTPIRGGRWYFAVESTSATASFYRVGAELRTRSSDILSISDGFGALSGTSGGPAVQEFHFPNPGFVTALAFEIYDLTGPADLQVSPDAPMPVAQVSLTNPQPGNEPELVVVRAGIDFPTLAHDWYMRVTLPSTNQMTYRIRVNIERDGVLPIATPIHLAPVVTAGELTGLEWRSVVGQRYRVDCTGELTDTPVWIPISTNTATTDRIFLPIAAGGSDPTRYYRAVQVSRNP